MLFCCCSNKKDEETDDILGDLTNKLKLTKQILVEFTNEEQKLGMKDVDTLQLVQLSLQKSSKDEIPKLQIKELFENLKGIDLQQVYYFLAKDCFFTDHTRTKYDLSKILTFNLLYTGGSDYDKTTIFLMLVEDKKVPQVENKSFKLIKGIENLVIVSCIVVSDILAEKKRFVGDKNEKTFEELRILYTTNQGIIRDFAIDMIDQYLFPPSEKRVCLSKVDFIKVMEQSNNILLKPHEIRKKYTEYVYTHRQQASIPLRPIQRKTGVKPRESVEESKVLSQYDNEFRGSRHSYKDFLKDSNMSKQSMKSKNRKLKDPKNSSQQQIRQKEPKQIFSGNNLNEIQEEQDHQIADNRSTNPNLKRNPSVKHVEQLQQLEKKQQQQIQLESDLYNQQQQLIQKQLEQQKELERLRELYNKQVQETKGDPNKKEEKDRESQPLDEQQHRPISAVKKLENKQIVAPPVKSGPISQQISAVSSSKSTPQPSVQQQSPQIQQQQQQSVPVQQVKKQQNPPPVQDPPPQSQPLNSNDVSSIQKSESEKGDINIIRYEDKSNRETAMPPPQVSPAQPQKVQSQVPQKQKELEIEQQESLAIKGEIEKSSNKDLGNSNNLRRAGNQNSIRETSETSHSLNTNSQNKKLQSVQAYLKDLFGDQFVNFSQEIQKISNIEDPSEEKRLLKSNLEYLNKGRSDELQFPNFQGYQFHTREVFQYFKALVSKQDLIDFAKGTYYKENIINVYYKILEKINLVNTTYYNQIVASNQSTQDGFIQYQPYKIQYFSTKFCEKLLLDQNIKDSQTQLLNFNRNDIAILPFYVNNDEDARTLVVVIRVEDKLVDLFDRERETDNHPISDAVLQMMNMAADLAGKEFNVEDIDGGVETVYVDREEDMIVSVCHIAECLTFSKQIDLEQLNINKERQRIVNALIQLLKFK